MTNPTSAPAKIKRSLKNVMIFTSLLRLFSSGIVELAMEEIFAAVMFTSWEDDWLALDAPPPSGREVDEVVVRYMVEAEKMWRVKGWV